MSRNQATILLTLLTVIIAAWLYLYYQHWLMTSLPMSEMWMPSADIYNWQWTDFWLVYTMWAVMMIAMMLPTAIPMVAVYTKICEQRYQTAYTHTLLFVFAYLVVWLVFSIALSALQWQMHGLNFLTPMMDMQHDQLAAILFLLAGAYQFTPQKNKFLQSCRTPMGFVLTEWREGTMGAFQMGIKHGSACLGCCWAQMLIMFAVGVMSLLGMVFITLLVFAEKIVPPRYRFFSKAVGILFIVWSFRLFIS
ncbi:Predicted metal-binding membrane protein [Nitrosomonas marina]|uniref:Predicted metal-binding membrane protein n=1 Tax=Nitrosomonas marina TaxID=917 RepID=A0A1H9ZR17_9PROT|nr:DUF2182 domain-containing protein [Nitrosomonas marina]SES84125.1 Predicted metal-binding membrane protein [Nitrosomonas marina]